MRSSEHYFFVRSPGPLGSFHFLFHTSFWNDKLFLDKLFLGQFRSAEVFTKREGVPEMGTRPLRALRGYRASNRGSNRGYKGL